MKNAKAIIRSRKFWIGLGCSFLALIIWQYVKLEPKSWLGRQKFQVGYHLSADKDPYLQNYWADVKEYDGAWLSTGSNDFLWNKLSNDIAEEEFDAILNFYLGMGSARRRYSGLTEREGTKFKVIARLIARLPGLDRSTKKEAIKWIEEFRRNESFGKGDIYCPDWDLAAEFMTDWWKRDLPWKKKRKIDPLIGTGSTIHWGT